MTTPRSHHASGVEWLHRWCPSVLILIACAACDDALAPTSGDPPGDSKSPDALAPEIDPQHNVVMVWGEAVLESIRETLHGPPMTGRSLAIVHTAMYDAWAAYDDVAVGTRLGGALRRPASERTEANKAEAISFAAYRALIDLFPGRVAAFDALMRALGYDPADQSRDATTPAGVGSIASAAVLAFRHHDGANQLGGYADYTGYTPVNPPIDPSQPGVGALVDPFRWQPLIHNGVVQRFTAPHWEHVIPFALPSADAFMPPPPARVGSGRWHRQVQELIRISAKLTDEQKVVAEYWADGPDSEFPPGHWCVIARYVSLRDGNTLDEDVRMFFVVANAVFDAGIAAWTAKVRYDYVRPVTAIRYEKRGKTIRAWAGPGLGSSRIDGDRWLPYQPATFRTPPFAEYVSGHSTFSMAAATALKRFTGRDAFGACASFPPGWSRVEPGIAPTRRVELCWKTFTDAARQAGMSRLYGGIHFSEGNLEGLRIGRRVGERVWRTAQTYFDGTAAVAVR